MTATEAPGRRRAGGVVTDAPPRVDTAPAVSRRRRALRPYLLAVLAVLLCVGILYPFFLAVAYTFFNFSDANPQPSFVGLRNYVEIFTSGSFWNSVRVTVLFAAVATTVE